MTALRVSGIEGIDGGDAVRLIREDGGGRRIWSGVIADRYSPTSASICCLDIRLCSRCRRTKRGPL